MARKAPESVILERDSSARCPFCDRKASLGSGVRRQRVKCRECAFPWLVKRTKEGFDWMPNDAEIGRELPPMNSVILTESLAASILSKGRVARASTRRRTAGRRRPARVGGKAK